MTATTKTAAANLRPGMTVQVTDLEPLVAGDDAVGRLRAQQIERGETHNVPCGSVKASSPVRTVAAVDLEDQRYSNLRAVRVEFTTGEVVSISTRQKVVVL